jgi:hypothetical protein
MANGCRLTSVLGVKTHQAKNLAIRKFMSDYIFWTILAIVAGTFLWRVLRYGGFRAAMFGSSIQSTVGEVQAEKSKMFSQKLKVYRLSGAPDGRAVGIELVSKSIASYQMLPVTLSAQAARDLAALLHSAAAGR